MSHTRSGVEVTVSIVLLLLFIPSNPTAPAAAQSNVVWLGWFYAMSSEAEASDIVLYLSCPCF